MKNYDLIVIGSGAAMSTANRALKTGLKVALIEEGNLGGTCLNRGCIPSKILVYPADIIREAEHAKSIGVEFEFKRLDWSVIRERVWYKINQNKNIEKNLVNKENLELYRGVAEFVGDYIIKVKNNDGTESEEISGEKIVIGTGGRSIIPPIPGLKETGFVNTKSFFGEKFPKKPWKSLIIIGGSIIAAEFAHMFSAFGTEVTIVEMLPRLVFTEEPEVSAFLQKEFEKHMKVLVNHKAISVKKEGENKIVIIEDVITGAKKEVSGEEIFLAVGRRSNADILKVEKAGIEIDKRGWIVVNKYLETNKKNIWAIGDINGKYQFRHKANYESKLCSHNMFSDNNDKIETDYSTVPWAIFTYPQIAHVGMTEQEAIDKGFKIYVGIHHYSEVAKGYAMGFMPGTDDDGFVKMVVDKSKKILGVSIVGPFAATLVQQFVYLMNAGYTCAPPEDVEIVPKYIKACSDAGSYLPIKNSMIIHPSINEVAGWAIGELKPKNF